MSNFRTRWLALFGAVTLIALSMSSALGAKPDAGENRGQQVSAFVHSLQGDVEESDEEAEVEDSASSGHGECVREVAKDHEAVGGENENHGGAVSQAARVTCWEEGSAEELDTEEPAEDEGDSEDESDEDRDDESEAETEDAGESDGGSEHGNGHGGGHEDDGSDD